PQEMSIGCPAPSMMRTQARRECGHRSTGPSTVVDQSTARIRAPISPPPANTDSINGVLLGSMAESLDSAPASSGLQQPIASREDAARPSARRWLILPAMTSLGAPSCSTAAVDPAHPDFAYQPPALEPRRGREARCHQRLEVLLGQR